MPEATKAATATAISSLPAVSDQVGPTLDDDPPGHRQTRRPGDRPRRRLNRRAARRYARRQPPLVIVAAAVLEELQVTGCVRFCVLSSL